MVTTLPKPKNTQQNQQNPSNEAKVTPRYPDGCPIQGHEGYGCTCNPIKKKE